MQRRPTRNFTLLVIFLSLLAFALEAQEPALKADRLQVPVASATRVTQAPVVDGRLDDDVWSDIPILSDFVQREPAEGAPVSKRTEIRLVYDEAALYVGAWMFVADPCQDELTYSGAKLT